MLDETLIPLSVSGLTSLIKSNLETVFPSVLVEGEISNAKLAVSGHFYFSLKDEQAMVQAVMFRFKVSALRFEPADGMKVRVRGSVSVYPARGQYQLIAQSMQKSGLGDILAILEERKARLAAEGLFDGDKKRPIPGFPSRIGVVTSPNGAAIHDILNVLRRRNPGVDVLILPTPVQGEGAPEIIARRIEQANLLKLADVLIVARGGGSVEDLLAFSDERVVRAIAESKIPTISAVGHEVDWALSDFAADLRAPTPSAAAELVCESRDFILNEIRQFSLAIGSSMRAIVDSTRIILQKFSPSDIESRFMRLFLSIAKRLDDSRDTLAAEIRGRAAALGHRIELSEQALAVASPQAVLERGFSIVTKSAAGPGSETNLSPGGKIVRSSSSLRAGERVNIRFAAGTASADIAEVQR